MGEIDVCVLGEFGIVHIYFWGNGALSKWKLQVCNYLEHLLGLIVDILTYKGRRR